MKRRYIKRKKITRSDIVHRIASLIGLNPRVIKDGYFSRQGLTELALKLEQLNSRIKDFEDATGTARK